MEGNHFVFWRIIGGVVVAGKCLVMMGCGLCRGGGVYKVSVVSRLRGRGWWMKMEGTMTQRVVFKRDILVQPRIGTCFVMATASP